MTDDRLNLEPMTFTMMCKMSARNKTIGESVIKVNAGKLCEMLVVRIQEAHA